MSIFEACCKHDILICGFDSLKLFHLISNAVNISRHSGDNVTNGKNISGNPYLRRIYSMCSNSSGKLLFDDFAQNELKSTILECLILNEFNFNSIDTSSNETILFDLIRSNDILGLKIILNKHVKEKNNELMINYHNNEGISPLYLAIQHYIELKNQENSIQINRKQYIYELLIDSGISNASLNFAAFEMSGIVRSILGYVLLRKEWTLARRLSKRGAILNARELDILVGLYSDVVYQALAFPDENNDTVYALETLTEIVDAMAINLNHLADRNGNNPIHRFARAFERNAELVSISGIDHAVSVWHKLLDVCPAWLLMENKDKEVPFEILVELLFFAQNSDDEKSQKSPKSNSMLDVDVRYVALLNGIMNALSDISNRVFTKVTTYGLLDYTQCILYLDIVQTLAQTQKLNNTEVSKLANTFATALLTSSTARDEEKTDTNLSDALVGNHSRLRPDDDGTDDRFVDKEEKSQNQDKKQFVSDGEGDGDNNNRPDINLLHIEKMMNQEKEPLSWFEWVYIFGVESLSCADIITDIFILIQLVNDTHLWWSTFGILFTISPYLVSYTAMSTVLHKKIKSHLLSVLTMTPLCILYFLLLDVIFLIYALISSLIFLITATRVNIGSWMEDRFFRRFLGISRMELVGYRRLRMLYILGDNGTVDISYQSLYYSLLFAFLHILMEGSIIYLDSKACHLELIDYGVICLFARLQWVPFVNILIGLSKQSIMKMKLNHKKHNAICKLNTEHHTLDFENIVSKFCGLKYKLDFEFCKDSWQIFIKYINDICSYCPSIETNNFSENTISIHENIDGNKLLTPLFATSICKDGIWSDVSDAAIWYNNQFGVVQHVIRVKLGKHCCKMIDLFDIYRLYQVGSNKVIIDCGDIDWKQLVQVTQIYHNYDASTISDVLYHIFACLLKTGDFNAVQDCVDALGTEEFDLYIRDVDISNMFNGFKMEILSNARYNILPLKRCYQQCIIFGLKCQESNIVYSIIYELIRPVLHSYNNDTTFKGYKSENSQRIYTMMLLLWYTQGVIKTHHCYQCDKDWIDHIIDFELSYKRRMDVVGFGPNNYNQE